MPTSRFGGRFLLYWPLKIYTFICYTPVTLKGETHGKKWRDNLNVPNALTMLRLLLIPVFCVLMLRDYNMPALAVFILASVTDVLDGYIARKYNLITDFGKLADPLADKLMVLSLMILLAYQGAAPWAAVIILLAKELVLMLGSLFVLRNRKVVVFAQPIGKIAQFVSVVGLGLCFFTVVSCPCMALASDRAVAGGLAMVALVFYAKTFFDILKDNTHQGT